MAKLAETVAEPQPVDAGEAYRAYRAQNPIPALEAYRKAAELAPTPDHAIPRNPPPAEPQSHSQPKPEPSWPKAIGEVLIYVACILVALPAGAVLLDAFIWVAIHAWDGVGRFLGGVRP